MQITNEFKPLFSYSLITILFFLILLFINLYFLLKLINNKVKENIPEVKQPSKDLILIKNRFIKEIDLLKLQIENNEITNRKAYQRLSKIIRTFIYEMTSIKVPNYTLEEIKKININSLTQLVEEYYDPEFSKISKGNIKESIEKTRQVIDSWK